MESLKAAEKKHCNELNEFGVRKVNKQCFSKQWGNAVMSE